MADDTLTVIKETVEDNVADRQVEFVAELEGEEYSSPSNMTCSKP
jgi:hypothetical protein